MVFLQLWFTCNAHIINNHVWGLGKQQSKLVLQAGTFNFRMAKSITWSSSSRKRRAVG
uniref:Uncharacterized protein n=1 Tax=Anguilla anguilla TaxID=7936 RepID=A0A0E9WGH7_ANGAN